MAGAIALVHSQVQEGGEAVKQDDVMPYFICVILGIMIGGFAGGCSGVAHTKREAAQEAIRAGVAYYTNDASGTAQFKWKECK